jgi:hypothetical protein
MQSSTHTPVSSQLYLSLVCRIWYISDPQMSSSFICTISHTHLSNLLGTATMSDPLALLPLNRISLDFAS